MLKNDEGRENNAANGGVPRRVARMGASTLRGTLLLRTAISRTLAKDRDCHRLTREIERDAKLWPLVLLSHGLKAPCLHLSK